jgi:hypothetical protein
VGGEGRPARSLARSPPPPRSGATRPSHLVLGWARGEHQVVARGSAVPPRSGPAGHAHEAATHAVGRRGCAAERVRRGAGGAPPSGPAGEAIACEATAAT